MVIRMICTNFESLLLEKLSKSTKKSTKPDSSTIGVNLQLMESNSVYLVPSRVGWRSFRFREQLPDVEGSFCSPGWPSWRRQRWTRSRSATVWVLEIYILKKSFLTINSVPGADPLKILKIKNLLYFNLWWNLTNQISLETNFSCSDWSIPASWNFF